MIQSLERMYNGYTGDGCFRSEEPDGTENEGLHSALGCWDKGYVNAEMKPYTHCIELSFLVVYCLCQVNGAAAF